MAQRKSMALLEPDNPALTPLADKMRPRTLDEVVGQPKWVAKGSLLHRAIETGNVPSLIVWGPPGSGKTSLAYVVAQHTQAHFETLSAVLAGVADLRKVLARAAENHAKGEPTVLFIDEIHRFNRAQQDALLPHVEKGIVTLIGATTENPSFAVNHALLSRTRVLRLEAISEADLVTLLHRALQDRERGLGELELSATESLLLAIARIAAGDARRALGILELAAREAAQQHTELSMALVEQAAIDPYLGHDKTGEQHYNVVSAFIKSMRGTDPDAALYWMLRMLEGGEDPAFILRRMLIFASEDIGNADPRALLIAVAADQAYQRLGMPESMHTIAQCCTYLASAPKSNASYVAWQRAKADVDQHGALPVPLKLRNAVTSLMRAEKYGQGYRYPHDEGGYAPGETYLPEKLKAQRYYHPKSIGYEKHLHEFLRALRAQSSDASAPQNSADSGRKPNQT